MFLFIIVMPTGVYATKNTPADRRFDPLSADVSVLIHASAVRSAYRRLAM